MTRSTDKIRMMTLGKQETVSTKTKTGFPTGGSDGDIRVQATKHGPALFVKYNNEWYQSSLSKVGTAVEKQSINTTLIRGMKDAVSAGGTSYIQLDPNNIPPGSVVGILLFMNHSSDYWHVYNWMEESSAAAAKHEVFYRMNTHRVEIRLQGTQIKDAKGYRLLVFHT